MLDGCEWALTISLLFCCLGLFCSVNSPLNVRRCSGSLFLPNVSFCAVEPEAAMLVFEDETKRSFERSDVTEAERL